MIAVDRTKLVRALSFSSAVVQRRNFIPALSTVRAVANGSLKLDASDLDNFTSIEVPYDGDPTGFCIPEPKALTVALKQSGGDSVTMDTDKHNTFSVGCGAFLGRLSAPPVDNHVGSEAMSDEFFGCDIAGGELMQIDRVRGAISKDNNHYYFQGIHVAKIGDWLYRFTATDGHRLMWVDIPLPNAIGQIEENTIWHWRTIKVAIDQFAKVDEPIRLSLVRALKKNTLGQTLDNSASFPRVSFSSKIDGMKCSLIGKMIDGTYPDTSRVIPTTIPFALRVKRADLKNAIKSLSPLTSKGMRAVKMNFSSDRVNLSVHSPDIGDISFDISAEHNLPDTFKISFNGNYLLDLCDALHGEEISFGLTCSRSPTLITDPADTAFGSVLMPIMVSQ